jgi:hypothetical protein
MYLLSAIEAFSVVFFISPGWSALALRISLRRLLSQSDHLISIAVRWELTLV